MLRWDFAWGRACQQLVGCVLFLAVPQELHRDSELVGRVCWICLCLLLALVPGGQAAPPGPTAGPGASHPGTLIPQRLSSFSSSPWPFAEGC